MARIILCVVFFLFSLFSTSLYAEKRQFQSHPFFMFGLGEHLSAGLALGDVDGDGDLDVVVANGRHWAEQDYIYYNMGNGKLPIAKPLGQLQLPSYSPILFRDPKTQALQLLVVHDYLAPSVYSDLSRLTPHHSFLFGEGGRARDAVVADFNGDTFLDVIVVQRLGDALLYRGTKKGFSSPKIAAANTSHSTSIAAADLDNDGDKDVVLARRDGEQSLVLWNTGKGQFSVKTLANSVGDTRAVALADVDHDGFTDIVLGRVGAKNRIYFGDAQGDFSRVMAVGKPEERTFAIAVGDIDHSGWLDIVAGNDEQPNTLTYINNAASQKSVNLSDASQETYGVAMGDMNGDGYEDIVVANSDDMNEVMINNAGH